MSHIYRQSMWRGAKVGALLVGLFAFVTGITVCICYSLPIPPIAITEIGVVLGGLLGALCGYVACFPAGLSCLRGLMLGGLLGLPIALCSEGALAGLTWLGCLVMAGLVGYQAGCTRPDSPSSEWKACR